MITIKSLSDRETNTTKFWTVYGKSGSGKTHFTSTFPKPILYVLIGDEGINSVYNKKGVHYYELPNTKELPIAITEIDKMVSVDNSPYKTVVFDTFSNYVAMWQDEFCNPTSNLYNKKSVRMKMTMQAWGDLKSDIENCIGLIKKLSNKVNVVLTCHEIQDSFEGLESEILPDIRINLNKGSRSFLESMTNIGIHTTVLASESDEDDGNTQTEYIHAAHIGQNPYYWTKTQKSAAIQLPSVLLNPTYKKIMALLNANVDAQQNNVGE